MKQFFLSWPLWAKLTFILILALTGVVCVGYIKSLWDDRKMRIQEILDEERSVMMQDRDASRSNSSDNTPDPPFGVRALQSGVQIEGIWTADDYSDPNHRMTSGGPLTRTLIPSNVGPSSSVLNLSEFEAGLRRQPSGRFLQVPIPRVPRVSGPAYPHGLQHQPRTPSNLRINSSDEEEEALNSQPTVPWFVDVMRKARRFGRDSVNAAGNRNTSTAAQNTPTITVTMADEGSEEKRAAPDQSENTKRCQTTPSSPKRGRHLRRYSASAHNMNSNLEIPMADPRYLAAPGSTFLPITHEKKEACTSSNRKKKNDKGVNMTRVSL